MRDEAVMSLTSSMIIPRQIERGSELEEPVKTRKKPGVSFPSRRVSSLSIRLTSFGDEKSKHESQRGVSSADPKFVEDLVGRSEISNDGEESKSVSEEGKSRRVVPSRSLRSERRTMSAPLV